MIEQIITPEEEKEFYRLASLVGTDARDPKGKLMAWLEKKFSSYNKQLLDGVEGEIKEIDPLVVIDSDDTEIAEDLILREQVLSTLNKYRV